MPKTATKRDEDGCRTEVDPKGAEWRICALPRGRCLSASIHGTPFMEHPGRGLRPAGWCSEILSHIESEDREAVLAWLALPTDPADPMFDLKAKAARDFTSRPVWES